MEGMKRYPCEIDLGVLNSATMLLRWWFVDFEMSQQGSECLLVGCVVLPVGEVTNVSC